ncbi:MAG: hypothetical protein OXF54_22895 [Caldilineaceae bacterium]|nr:hypothetical protein [Caldilineaceae bacterium]
MGVRRTGLAVVGAGVGVVLRGGFGGGASEEEVIGDVLVVVAALLGQVVDPAEQLEEGADAFFEKVVGEELAGQWVRAAHGVDEAVGVDKSQAPATLSARDASMTRRRSLQSGSFSGPSRSSQARKKAIVSSTEAKGLTWWRLLSRSQAAAYKLRVALEALEGS